MRMFCSNCGKEIDDKATFCRHCGAGVSGEASPKLRGFMSQVWGKAKLGYQCISLKFLLLWIAVVVTIMMFQMCSVSD